MQMESIMFAVCVIKKIKSNQDLMKGQRRVVSLLTFPAVFLEELKEQVDDKNNVHLNTLEQHILKFIVPFIRFAYLEGKNSKQNQSKGKFNYDLC